LRGEEIICSLVLNQRSGSWDSFGVVGQISRTSFICPPIPATSHTQALCSILSDDMRLLITILFLGQLIETLGQKPYDDKNLPFQVVYAENVYNDEGQKVNNLQLIPVNEVLTIRQGGFLSMIHYFGFPIEFEGDTTINIEEIQTQFDLLKLGKKKWKYSELRRPSIEYLFIDDGKQGRKNKLSSTGACHDCNFDLDIVYPPKYKTSEIMFDNDLCIVWQSTNSNKYEVEVKNMFDEKIKTYSSTTNELKIDKEEINALADKEKALFFRIKDINSKNVSDVTIVRKFPLNTFDFPFSCAPQKATYSLIAGFYLEMFPVDHIKEAETYFKLATELSDKQFFKTMLDNFNKRRQ